MTKLSKDQDAPPEKASGPSKKNSEFPVREDLQHVHEDFQHVKETDMLMILKNQKVIMRGMFEIMKTMTGNMEIAEEIKAQAKVNYDYIVARED